ncbi:MAG: esterase-like activity of phytase family protein [Williamsia sp.]|nr:esterase-like activity of phytase family protein [Williamsia sp.]
MNPTRKIFFLLTAWALFLASCKTGQKIAGNTSSISHLSFINVVELPHNIQYKNTTVGGLSSIDYDAKTGQYYMICDDRSNTNPARYYTARIKISSKGIDSVQFVDVTTLLQPDGSPFPDYYKDALHACDPEGLRYNPHEDVWVWSSEGERLVKPGDTVLTDPSINVMQKDGRHLYSFDLPSNLHMQAREQGPRRNGVFEGLAFSDDGQTLYASVEEPLYEDGPRAGLGDTAGWIRIIRYDVVSRRPLAQYAYRIDPVAHPPSKPGEFIINGVPDILFLDKQHLLVTERSFSTGYPNCTIKLYLADLSGATDVSAVSSLQQPASFHPITKKLLLNLDSLHIYIDNVEGATFGPPLPNGHKTLVLVADNNFEQQEKTQFFLFEVVP